MPSELHAVFRAPAAPAEASALLHCRPSMWPAAATMHSSASSQTMPTAVPPQYRCIFFFGYPCLELLDADRKLMSARFGAEAL